MSATDDLCRSYLDLKWHFDPAAASAAGLTAYDNRLGEFDAESMRRHLAAFRAIAVATEELEVDGVQEEIDRTALLNEIRSLVFRFEHERPERRNPEFWLSHLFQGLYAIVGRRTDEPGQSAGAAVDRLKAVPAFLDAARATLHAPASVFVDTALGMLGGGGELVARMAVNLGRLAPELATELSGAATEALTSLTRFGAALKSEIEPSPDPDAFAVGEEQFTRRLYYEHALSAGPERLLRYGVQVEQELEAEIARVASRLDGQRPWREVVERIREQGSPSGDLLAVYCGEVERARQFVVQRDLVEMPQGVVEVMETPAFLRPLLPFAAYEPPPIYLPDRTGRFYVTLPAAAAAAAAAADAQAHAGLRRSHAVAGLPSLVAHETYPGHHLQLLRAQSAQSEVRRHLWTPLTVEGWALYGEELMSDEGYYRDDAERLLYLVSRLWRATRVVLDIGLHTRGLTPAEAASRLSERIPMERRSVEAEVRRYCAWPTYQLCYEIGRREIRRLRDASQARAGSTFRLRGFHDELMSYGGLPVSLVAWGMGLEQG